jgi:molybdopterin/thiamine biosynthesis adenylyltransferase
MDKLPKGFVTGWRVNIPAGSLELKTVDHLVLAVDAAFPHSQPRIFAPAAGSDYSWPHVEPAGLLCLRSSRNSAPIADRVQTHLSDAEELLNFPEPKRREEFEREFMAYWSHRATNSTDRARVWSLVTPGGVTREVACFFDARSNRHVIADDKDSLKRWLRNTGANPGDKQIYPTWLFRLSQPWTPREFPETGDEITKLLPQDIIRKCLEPGLLSPFLFEVDTKTGTAFAAVVLRGAERRDVMKGFRHMSKVPAAHIVGSYAKRPVERCKVARVDGAWVHGRDHPSSYALIKNRKVAIVGCGAVGAAVARLLAQSGVGEQIFVDVDSLSTANVSRHPLGMFRVGLNKATALKEQLQREFPHLAFEHSFRNRVESLSSKELEKLASADLIVSAGIDFDGEAALDHWRRSLERPPAHLSTWTEAFAVAGHAVLLYGRASILTGFDDEERPSFRLTDWPDESGALIVEAGCGNSFQPHGVIDLHPTVGMAAGLALNTLLDKVPSSCRRAWMGDPAAVEANGGILREAFTARLTMREFAWP